MKGWKDNKSTIDNLSDRLDRLEAEVFIKQSDADEQQQQELEKLTPTERYILKFNRSVKEIMPYYKAEVMQLHSISSEEYDRRTLEGDESIYLPQPNSKFESTSYAERVAQVLGLDYEGLQVKISRGEIKDLIATGGTCLYRRLFLDYTYGLGKIYAAEEIRAAKASPSIFLLQAFVPV